MSNTNNDSLFKPKEPYKVLRPRHKSFRVYMDENRIQLDNKHVFIGVSKDDVRWIYAFGAIPNSKLHIYLANDMCFTEDFFGALKHLLTDEFNSRIFIHIPHKLADLKYLLLKKSGLQESKRFRIETSRVFSPLTSYTYRLKVEYKDNELISSIELVSAPADTIIKPINTRNIELKDITQYRRGIVEDFKATTPLSILKSFNDEDDIWDFIMMNGQWKADDKELSRATRKKPDMVSINEMINKALMTQQKGGGENC